MVDQEPRRSDAAVRRAIRRQWEAEGRPPCRICRTPVADDEASYASRVWKTVVHRLCSGVTGASANLAEACKKDRHGALDLCSWPKFCPCPHSSVTNAIVAARRCGLPTVEVATANSPGCERAALEAGLGTHYEGVPLRESLRFADLVKHGFVPDQEALNELSTWYEPPELLVIDVAKSIRDGRIVAVPGP